MSPYDVERESWTAGAAVKNLVLLAADSLTERCGEFDADLLVDEQVLPRCFRSRYDAQFLRGFRNELDVTRNLLVSDIQQPPHVASELSAHSILREARRLLEQRPGPLGDARLAEVLERDASYVSDELDALYARVIEDDEVLRLFDIPEGAAAAEIPDERLAHTRFENWWIPYDRAPRPGITYDGRAWPTSS